jgi:hypothetical protein
MGIYSENIELCGALRESIKVHMAEQNIFTCHIREQIPNLFSD